MKNELKKILSARGKNRKILADRVPSAVLIPLYEKQGQWHILFIRRTDTVKTHKGQISFPGGAREPGDKTLKDTAVREAYEEIGLKPEAVEILGELDDEITTTSHYVVTPFVAGIPWPYEFVINRREVADIIEVPIPALLEADCLRQETEYLKGRAISSYAYYYEGERIWGATARILYKLLEIISSMAVKED